ncbi:hypothetical protein IJL65_03560 [bacterium]|nr:hypothetical protein [bacterium]
MQLFTTSSHFSGGWNVHRRRSPFLYISLKLVFKEISSIHFHVACTIVASVIIQFSSLISEITAAWHHLAHDTI